MPSPCAMRLGAGPGSRLVLPCARVPGPGPGPGQVRVAVAARAVCRTGLHAVDGEPGTAPGIIRRQETIGRIEVLGRGATAPVPGTRADVPWLRWTCGIRRVCATGGRPAASRRASPAGGSTAAMPGAFSPMRASAWVPGWRSRSRCSVAALRRAARAPHAARARPCAARRRTSWRSWRGTRSSPAPARRRGGAGCGAAACRDGGTCAWHQRHGDAASVCAMHLGA